MANTYNYPVIVWQDSGGLFTARIVQRNDTTSAVGQTPEEAILHLKEFFQWTYDKEQRLPDPDMLEPKLTQIKVNLIAVYKEWDSVSKERIYPCNELIAIKFPCVHGPDESGMSACLLPTLDIFFNYYSKKDLKSLVIHFAREKFNGMTPKEIAEYLPPNSCSLHEIIIKKKARPQKERSLFWDLHDEFESLASVAEPFGMRSLRGKYASAWERDDEVADLLQRLKAGQTNIILVGEPGVGKTTVLFDAARRLEREAKNKDSDVVSYRLWMTNASRIIAGMKYLGQWQERCEGMVVELSMANGILCVENILDLIRTGGKEPIDSVAAFFVNFLKRREVSIIGEATPAELDACRRLLPGFVDLFQILNIPAFPERKARSVLNKMINNFSQNMHIKSDPGVADIIYRFFARFMPYSVFPGKSIVFLQKIFEKASADQAGILNGQFIIEQFIARTGLPELFLNDDITLDRKDVLAEFNKQIIGQEAACEAAAKLVTTFKAGMNDPNRPLGVLLFCGPTGVGKTALARTLSNYFFGHGEESDRLIRLDMSEYNGPGAAERLLSGPEGEPSDLVKKIRRQPFSLVLLDEIEKASMEVFDVFLNMFDEGRLVDRYGRITTFRSAIIIMTSNLGASSQESIGFGEQSASYESEIKSYFRPEFFNRIDQVVTFNPLNRSALLKITEKEISEISAREGLAARNIQLSWTEQLVNHIAEKGFDHRFGARPLQRAVEKLLVTPLARYLAANPDTNKTTIKADLNKNGEVVLDVGK